MSGMKPIFRGGLAFCTACLLMVCCAPDNSSESEKREAEAYIKSHHAEAMELYDNLVEEGNRYINEGNNS